MTIQLPDLKEYILETPNVYLHIWYSLERKTPRLTSVTYLLGYYPSASARGRVERRGWLVEDSDYHHVCNDTRRQHLSLISFVTWCPCLRKAQWSGCGKYAEIGLDGDLLQRRREILMECILLIPQA